MRVVEGLKNRDQVCFLEGRLYHSIFEFAVGLSPAGEVNDG